MPTNELITVTLTPELSDRVRSEIANHGYSNPLDVIEHGLDALGHKGEWFEPWIRQEIMDACDELDRNPSSVLTLDELGQELKAEYARFPKGE
jgi:Arc/MetJ-type ribon-helix-helix transcriptional regulator